MENQIIPRPLSSEHYPVGLKLDRLVTQLLCPEGVVLPEGEGRPVWRPVRTYTEEFRPSDCVRASSVISKAIAKLGPPPEISSTDGPWWMGQWRPNLIGSTGYLVGWCCHPWKFEEWYEWTTAPRLPHAICLAGLKACQAKWR